MLKFVVPMLVMMITSTNQIKMFMATVIIIYNMSLQTWSSGKMTFIFMGDLLSFWNMNLSLWVTFILLFINTTNMKLHKNMMVTILMFFTMMFYTWNFLMFYMLFEMSMIVMMMVMVSWSYQPDRVEATMFLIIMALMFSLPFMITMMNSIKNLNFWFLKLNLSIWEYMSFMTIFMMKMPFYFMHFWLPKVHVEAPVQGSMILAAVMLKLGCYGMLRMGPLMYKFKLINMVVMSMTMWSMIVVSMSCFIQPDIKTLVAYSSIVHMGLVLITILINKKKSMVGSLTIMLSHGVCASALFFMANSFYKNSKSRSILMNKGSVALMPLMNILWFMMCMSNTPMPPAVSMIGELISLKLIIDYTKMVIMVFMMTLTSSLYSIFMFYSMNHGNQSKLNKMNFHMSTKSILILSMHGLPLIFLSMKPKMLMML